MMDAIPVNDVCNFKSDLFFGLIRLMQNLDICYIKYVQDFIDWDQHKLFK